MTPLNPSQIPVAQLLRVALYEERIRKPFPSTDNAYWSLRMGRPVTLAEGAQFDADMRAGKLAPVDYSPANVVLPTDRSDPAVAAAIAQLLSQTSSAAPVAGTSPVNPKVPPPTFGGGSPVYTTLPVETRDLVPVLVTDRADPATGKLAPAEQLRASASAGTMAGGGSGLLLVGALALGAWFLLR